MIYQYLSIRVTSSPIVKFPIFHFRYRAVLEDSSDGSPEFLSLFLGHYYFEYLLGLICLQKHQIRPQTQGTNQLAVSFCSSLKFFPPGCNQKRRSS